MTAPRVSPTEPNPTHHVSLRPRNGPTIGLILCDANGKPRWDTFRRNAIDRTSLKTSSGTSSYADLEHPYEPVVQDNWTSGRGNLDFEQDSSGYYDSFRMKSSIANKLFLGPQEQWSTGDHRDEDGDKPGDVTWKKLLGENQYLSRRFTASASYTAVSAWLLARKRGTPGDMTIAVHNDSAGSIGTKIDDVTVASTRMDDILSEWLNETISAALTSGTAYWIKAYGDDDDDNRNHWQVAVDNASGTTNYSSDGASWTSADFDLYFRLTDAAATKTVIFVEYKEAMYCFVSGTSGAPNVYINGDRGAADSNSGNLDKLIDAAKGWTTNEWAGAIVLITGGTGKGEPQRWRNISSNTATQLVVDEDWTITHDTTTEYVIIADDTWTEITGHGITAPVTDILVESNDYLLVCQGDSTNMRRHREFNDSGTWKNLAHADCKADDGTNKFAFLTFEPQANKIVGGNNSDGSGDISVDTADPIAWANHTFSGTPTVLPETHKMTGLVVYPDAGEDEAAWVGREEIPWVVPTTGNPYPFAIDEVRKLKDDDNCSQMLKHDVYLYMNMRQLVERWYNGSLDDVSPSQGEGLPANRRGKVVSLVGVPGKVLYGIDAGASGYSSVMEYDAGGLHEIYRGAKGERLVAMKYQSVAGGLDRLWIYIGNDIIWMPYPDEPDNELNDSDYLYTHEGAIVLSRMHAGMLDVQKLVKNIKLWCEDMSEDEQWVELDWRLDDDTAWLEYDEEFFDEPHNVINFGTRTHYGLGAKRYQFRIRFCTNDASDTPQLLAFIMEGVIRIGVKNIRPLVFRLADDDECLSAGERDEYADPMKKLAALDDMADETSNTLVYMRSLSPLYDDMFVFLNSVDVQQIKFAGTEEQKQNVYLCTATIQEA